MLKDAISLPVAQLENANTALDRLYQILGRIPIVSVITPDSGAAAPVQGDFNIAIDVAGARWTLVCKFQRLAQPRHVREALYYLRHRLSEMRSARVYGILITPYFSEESIAMLHEESKGYLDLAGNCLLSFDTVFIERSGASNLSARRRGLRDVFAPKAARIVRTLLQDPGRPWRVTDLARAAGVSLGQVANVRRALIDREWAIVGPSGLQIHKPAVVLDAWRGEYKAPVLHETHYYTLLHGAALESALRATFASIVTAQNLLLSSFSAARWLAPFARFPGHFFYADALGEESLKSALQLESVPRGANVIVSRPKGDDVFIGRLQPVEGLWSTGLVQTYLDLVIAGDRGREAADHLRHAIMEPSWHQT